MSSRFCASKEASDSIHTSKGYAFLPSMLNACVSDVGGISPLDYGMITIRTGDSTQEEFVTQKEKEEALRLKIDNLKRVNKGSFRSDIKPIFIEEFEDLLLPDKIDEIRANRGRVTFGKLLYDSNAVGDILSMVFEKLVQGSPEGKGAKIVKTNADKFAIEVAPIIADIKQQNPDCTSFRQVAAELTKRRVKTSRSSEGDIVNWEGTTVRNVEKRIQKLYKSGHLRPL